MSRVDCPKCGANTEVEIEPIDITKWTWTSMPRMRCMTCGKSWNIEMNCHE